MNYFKERRKEKQRKKKANWDYFFDMMDVIGEGFVLLVGKTFKVIFRILD